MPTLAPSRPSRLTTALAGLTALAAASTVVAAAPAAAAPARPAYTLTDLGPLAGGTASFALGVAADGTAVGTSRTGAASRPQLAVRWHDGRVEDLGTLPGSTFSRAFSVNAQGQAVGEAFTAPPEVSRAVMWEADGTLRDLGTLGGSSAVANDVDARGRAFGISSRTSGPSVATVWDRSGPRALPLPDPSVSGVSRASAVSSSGVAVGTAPARTVEGATTTQAARWTPRGQSFVATALEGLEPGRFAAALGISENGLIVGEASRLDPGTTRTSTRAVQWDGEVVRELPGLRDYRFTRANDVSSTGDAVGFASGFAGFPTIDGAAVLWHRGEALDLGSLVTGGTGGLVLRTAESIIANGAIVGFGSRDGQTRAFLLEPAGR